MAAYLLTDVNIYFC